MRTVFINPEQCIGCLQCEIACAIEHSASQDGSAAFLEIPVPRKRIHVQPGPVATTAFPNRCRHCDPAPCVQVCPAGALSRNAEAALVLIDEQRCIGCAMCAVVCPFDALTFHPLAEGPGPETAVAVKCDGCIDRVQRGETPVCVEVCKVEALIYGDINDLLAKGRLHDAGAVLAAAGGARTARPGGDPLAGWHAWGEAEQAASEAAQAAVATQNGHPRRADGEEARP